MSSRLLMLANAVLLKICNFLSPLLSFGVYILLLLYLQSLGQLVRDGI